uniref:H15 domain-containing protein n=1 Tax=Bracon brevicornis TaxID=1563983 RepID=A0A6V7LD83_9HYME
MLRTAVEELEKRRALVSSKMIADHLKRLYPIERNPEALKIELKDKLDHAVSIGILSRSNKDAYCCSTFRQEAYNYKNDFSSFWERHYRVNLLDDWCPIVHTTVLFCVIYRRDLVVV